MAAEYRLLWFILLLFTIDVSMLGYLVNKKVGAHVYNIGHSLLFPLFLLLGGFTSHGDLEYSLCLDLDCSHRDGQNAWVRSEVRDRVYGYAPWPDWKEMTLLTRDSFWSMIEFIHFISAQRTRQNGLDLAA
ncbi:MAG: hypothetical protein G01um101438_359 [Parcubacteria group bacterium Gr01-1014_38]|nr:MAG: hypothetical protein G01um101438_359 [Parcubacteria group bacterium Gr01-1014_38]